MNRNEDRRTSILNRLVNARAGYAEAIPLDPRVFLRYLIKKDLAVNRTGRDHNLWGISLPEGTDLTRYSVYRELLERYGAKVVSSSPLRLEVYRSQLKGIRMPGLNLAINGDSVDLEGADFSDGEITKSRLVNSFLKGATVTNTQFSILDSGVIFDTCDLRGLRGFETAEGIVGARYTDCLLSPQDIDTLARVYTSRFELCGALSDAEATRLRSKERRVMCTSCDKLDGELHTSCDHETCPICGEQLEFCGHKGNLEGKKRIPFKKDDVLKWVRESVEGIKGIAKARIR
ncbi:MAG TPA: hypothetical protein VJK07_01140 [Candidatus Nanoarchaeia archaeon]|nr:hypothetical protein [Candidatus Nanoarchaeia archaeon]